MRRCMATSFVYYVFRNNPENRQQKIRDIILTLREIAAQIERLLYAIYAFISEKHVRP